MNAGMEIPASSNQRERRDIFAIVLWIFVGCFAVSCLTLPFIGRVWLGEIPVLTVFQAPKIPVANWLRTHVVMEAIKFLGLSSGSFSPDYAMARPYALAIVYLIPMVIVAAVGLYRGRNTPTVRVFATVTFLFVATLDYVFTLKFADGRYLTIY